MSESIKERSQIEQQYKWDLSSLYADDEAWEKELETVEAAAEKVAAFQGKLQDAVTIRQFLDASRDLERLLSNLFCYASLRKSEDTRAEDAQSMYSRIYGKYVQAAAATSFGEPEMLRLPEEKLEEIAGSEELKDYRFNMTKMLRRKAHTLSEAEEKLLASFGEAFAAPGQISGSLRDADLVFEPAADSDGVEHEVTNANYILLQTSKDRVLRENAFRSFYKGYQQHINTFASSYAAEVKAAAAEAAVRQYGSSRELYMAGENIPASVYDNLIETVHQYMPLMHRYVSLRKKILGIDELHYYDVYAPLSDGVTQSYTYEQAQEMVLSAVKPLGEAYGDVVRGAFAEGWIDVYPNKGKRGGAFSSGTYDSKPYILTNFTGTLDSVSTIAHEMGHSMHTWYANHTQDIQNADYTIFVAEVASTCNENLLIEQLLADCDDPQTKLALLNQYLEGFKGTVYRQTMFAEFEKEAHAMAERGEALHAGSLSALYGRLVREYFGPELVMDEEVSLEWARIPHFYTPFYVYKYATSFAASVAISEEILQKGEPAVERYLGFLSLGGSMDPLEELQHAGVDLTQREPIEKALQKFEKVLEEAEKLV